MRNISEQNVRRATRALDWSSRIMGLTRVLGGISVCALLLNPVQGLSVTLPGSYSATLAWNRSPDSNVIGYRVYYGPASGIYTNAIDVGNITTNTVPGLTGGVTCFFAVTAYNALGLESDFSNEISYRPVDPGVRIRITPARQVVLTVTSQIGHTYEILATQDLKTWTVIGTVTVGAGGSLDFTDTTAANFPKRFYRIRETP
jgi:hypothetical protein